MSDSNEPLASLESTGKASVLLYDLPNPTSYSGRQLIDLRIPGSMFAEAAKQFGKATPVADQNFTEDKIRDIMKAGFADSTLFPSLQNTSVKCTLQEKDEKAAEVKANVAISKALRDLTPLIVNAHAQQGKTTMAYRGMYGLLKHIAVSVPAKPIPRLMLVETYSLSTFAGAYGAGRIINTFTLLPGEKTKISIHTYQKNTTEGSSGTSILDSFSEESADDFELTLQSEQSSQSDYQESFNYYADASCEPLWGLGGLDVSGGVSGGSNESRQDFSRMVSSSTTKHTQRASAKREVRVNTTHKESSASGGESSVEREIANLNESRALNFVFRQLNQEFISFLHLTDIKVAFFNGVPGSRKEVPLWKLDSLLREVVVAQKVGTVKKMILDELKGVVDYLGVPRRVLVDKAYGGGGKLLCWDSTISSSYTDPLTGKKIEIPGVILSVFRNVMRTDGVIVESVLSIGDALDDYQDRLHEAGAREKELQNKLRQIEIDRNTLGIDIIKAEDKAEADIYEEVFPPHPVRMRDVDAVPGNGQN
jgi:hypothetical protein